MHTHKRSTAFACIKNVCAPVLSPAVVTAWPRRTARVRSPAAVCRALARPCGPKQGCATLRGKCGELLRIDGGMYTTFQEDSFCAHASDPLPSADELHRIERDGLSGTQLAQRVMTEAASSNRLAVHDLHAMGFDTPRHLRALQARTTRIIAATTTPPHDLVRFVHDAWATATTDVALREFATWAAQGAQRDIDARKFTHTMIKQCLVSLSIAALEAAQGKDSGYVPTPIHGGACRHGEGYAVDTDWHDFPGRFLPTFRARRIIAMSMRLPDIDMARVAMLRKYPHLERRLPQLWDTTIQMVQSDLWRKIMSDDASRPVSSRLNLETIAAGASPIAWAYQMAAPTAASKLRDAMARYYARSVNYDVGDLDLSVTDERSSPLSMNAAGLVSRLLKAYVHESTRRAEAAYERVDAQVDTPPLTPELAEQIAPLQVNRRLHMGANMLHYAYRIPQLQRPGDAERVKLLRGLMRGDDTLAYASLQASHDLRRGCPSFDQAQLPHELLTLWSPLSITDAGRLLNAVPRVAHTMALAALTPLTWLRTTASRAMLTELTLDASRHPDWMPQVPSAVTAWCTVAATDAPSAAAVMNWHEHARALATFPGAPLGSDPAAWLRAAAPVAEFDEVAVTVCNSGVLAYHAASR